MTQVITRWGTRRMGRWDDEALRGPAPVNPPAHLYDNLTFWLPLDEASGNRIDAHGSKVFAQQGTVPSFNDPTFGLVADFPGTNGNWLRRAYDADLAVVANESFSFAFWLNMDSLAGFGGMYSLYDGAASNRTFYVQFGSDDLFFARLTGAAAQALLTVNNVLTAGAWSFVACVSDVANQRIGMSIDGGAFAYTPCATHTWVGNWGYNVGANDGNGGFAINGKMHAASLWRGLVVSDADVAWLYNAAAGRVYADVAALGA